jgi:hypothetical protein
VSQQLWQGWFHLVQQFGPTFETGTQADDEVEAIVRASESIPYLPDVPLNKLHIPKETPYERLPEIHVTSLFHIYI